MALPKMIEPIDVRRLLRGSIVFVFIILVNAGILGVTWLLLWPGTLAAQHWGATGAVVFAVPVISVVLAGAWYLDKKHPLPHLQHRARKDEPEYPPVVSDDWPAQVEREGSWHPRLDAPSRRD